MHPKQIRQVLDDEDTFDIAKAAEAILEENRLKAKKDKPKSFSNSIAAYHKMKAQEQQDEAFRQAVAKAWNKTHQ